MEMGNSDDGGEKWITHYSSRHKILLVGEGDFSFAACSARSFGSAANMQKIVIKVSIHCEKCRTKALKIAATTHGVNEVAIKGKERDELMVIGDEVDSVKLACSLRKKLRNATIVSVEEKKDEKKDEKKYEYFPSYYAHYPQYLISEVAHDPYQPTCSIM